MSVPDDDRFDESLLSAYADDELDDATRAHVDARLAASPALRAVLDEVIATRAAVRGLPDVIAPAGFWAVVLADDPVVVSMGATRRRRAPLGRWKALAGAAAAAVVLGVAVVPRAPAVEPGLERLSQTHGERASLDNDVVSNLAGVVVSQDELAP